MAGTNIKILSVIIIGIMVIAVTIGFISLKQAEVILDQESNEKFENLSRNHANEYSAILEGLEATVTTFSHTITSTFNYQAFIEDPNYRNEILMGYDNIIYNIAKDTANIQGIYFVANPELTDQIYNLWYYYNAQGQLVNQALEDIDSFYPENPDMKWYYNPIQANKGVWSLPYVDATINVKMISYTYPVVQEDRLIGVVGIDMAFDEILNTIRQMNIYERGYAALVDESYNVIFHPSIEEGVNMLSIENEDLRSVVNDLSTFEYGIHFYEFDENAKVMGYSRLSNGWILMTMADLAEVHQPIADLRDYMSISVTVIIVLASLLGVFFSKRLRHSLAKLHALTLQIADGNFNIDLEWTRNNELGALAKSFKIMSDRIAMTQKELLNVTTNLEYMAYHDSLTMLGNRRKAYEDLKNLLDQQDGSNSMSGIMLIDLDDFKTINDTYGHDAGDRMLLHVSNMMNHAIGNHDGLYRLGGDEFMVIFRKVPSFELVKILGSRMIESIRTPLQIEERPYRMTASIGVYILNGMETNVDCIIKNVDDAMYASKSLGGNSYQLIDYKKCKS